MTNDQIREFLDRFKQAWESQDVTKISDCYAADCVLVSPIFSTLRGHDAVKQSYGDLFKAFALKRIKVDDVVIGNEEPPRAVLVWKLESTHVGEVFGMPASGKPIDRTIAFILTLKDGKIAKEVRIYDFTSMLVQLGVLRVKPA
jgi:steroid delta-isomerase-like uncharacterized protein